MDLSFNVRDVAQRIRDARIGKNMTQMNLADEIGVSCQAVSNWERGNSLPDISKLRELCAILDISIDYLLGGDMSAAVEKAIDHMDGKPAEMTAKELSAIAPILPPDEIKAMAEENAAAPGGEISAEILCTSAPYLDSHVLEDMVDRIDIADSAALLELAPFLSKDAIDSLVEKVVEVSPDTLIGLAPFLSKDTLDSLAEMVDEISPNTLSELAPFLSKDTLDRLAERVAEISPNTLIELAPFFDKNTLNRLAEMVDEVSPDTLLGLAPFLSHQAMKKMIDRLPDTEK